MKKVLIVDSERNAQKAYQSDISAAADRYELVNAINDIEDAMYECQTKNVDLVLMELATESGRNSFDTVRCLKKRFPKLKVIITTSYVDGYILKKARQEKIDSFWFKNHSPIEIIDVMDLVVKGKNYWPKECPDVALGETTLSHFTDTEIAVLHYLIECITVKKIAEKLYVKESTVKTHLLNIYNKAGCSSKAELIMLIMRAKIVA